MALWTRAEGMIALDLLLMCRECWSTQETMALKRLKQVQLSKCLLTLPFSPLCVSSRLGSKLIGWRQSQGAGLVSLVSWYEDVRRVAEQPVNMTAIGDGGVGCGRVRTKKLLMPGHTLYPLKSEQSEAWATYTLPFKLFLIKNKFMKGFYSLDKIPQFLSHVVPVERFKLSL